MLVTLRKAIAPSHAMRLGAGFSVGNMYGAGKLTVLIGLWSKPRLELGPLPTSQLDLTTEVI